MQRVALTENSTTSQMTHAVVADTVEFFVILVVYRE
jgi:hypothetical protein